MGPKAYNDQAELRLHFQSERGHGSIRGVAVERWRPDWRQTSECEKEQSQGRGDLMSAEENKAIVRRFMKAYNNRELEIIEELVAEDYFDHVFEQQGREHLKQLFTTAFDAFPDW
jgi:hypothetical protein